MEKTSSPLITVFEGCDGLVHRAVHVIATPGGYYGYADCDLDLAGRTVRATSEVGVTCVRDNIKMPTCVRCICKMAPLDARHS